LLIIILEHMSNFGGLGKIYVHSTVPTPRHDIYS